MDIDTFSEKTAEQLVDAGLLRPELALAWYFDLPHETEAELAEIRRRFMGDAGRAH